MLEQPHPVASSGAGGQASPEVGEVLRSLRRAAGLTQQQLVGLLDKKIARSTLANIETGRERPSERVLSLLAEAVPGWSAPLRDAGRTLEELELAQPVVRRTAMAAGRGHAIAGPYVLERFQIVYVFGHSRAPEEIIETRRVRALVGGCDSFGLKFQAQSGGFETEREVLWGGRLASSERHSEDGRTVYLGRVDFGKSLRRGETHDFAVRRWVAHDPDPDTEALFQLTVPAKEVALHLKFHGPVRPRRIVRVGPLADRLLLAGARTAKQGTELDPSVDISEYFTRPEVGAFHGVLWDWETP